MDHYTLTNDPDSVTYEFDGELLGEASSQRDDSIRWTEVRIYKTDTGKYVAHVVGCSDVFHKSTARCASGELEVVQPEAELTPCPMCQPVITGDGSSFKVEVDRSNVYVSTKPDGVVESLMARDDDGTFYLTKVCRSALDRASDKDPALKQRTVAV